MIVDFKSVFYDRSFLFVFLLAVSIRLLYFFVLPVGQLPDEIYIFERIYSGSLAYISPALLANHNIYFPNSEYYHPPLYFFINSFLLQIIFRIRGLVSFGDAFLLYGPFFRLLHLLFSLMTIVFAQLILRSTKLNNSVRESALYLFCFIPTAIVFSFALNFHIYVFFATYFFVYLLFKNNLNSQLKSFVLGFICGLSLLVRFEGALLIPVYFVYVFSNKKIKQKVKLSAYFLFSTLLLGAWWYVANLFRFHSFYDPKILASTIETNIKPFAIANYFRTIVDQTIDTFIFTAGRTNNLRLTKLAYFPWKILLFFVFVVVLLRIKNLFRMVTKSPELLSLTVLFLGNLLVFIYINVKVNFSPQGRYFFPSLLALVVFLMLTISYLFPKNKLGSLRALVVLFLVVYNFWSFGCTLYFFDKIATTTKWLGCFNFPF